jgi:hypothetical protein
MHLHIRTSSPNGPNLKIDDRPPTVRKAEPSRTRRINLPSLIMHTRKSYSIEPALQGTHLRPKEFILHIPTFLPNSSLNSTGHYHNCLYPRTSSPNGPSRKIDHQWFGSRNPPEPEESILQVSSCIPRTFYTTEPALQDRHLRPKELILHIPTFF